MSIEKNTPQRNEVAKAARVWREQEQKHGVDTYVMRRSGADYMSCLRGIRHLFDYVRTLEAKAVLDIGAGSTKGIHQIAKHRFGKDLQFEATTLSRSTKESRFGGNGTVADLVKQNLGWDKTHITTMEVLRGIPDASKGAILAVYSLPYSKSPDMAVASIDRVLVPGGAFKGYFPERDESHMEAFGYKQFKQRFENRGYSVHAEDMQDGYVVVLAIKPGRANSPSAKQLSDLDQRDWEDQRDDLRDAYDS